MTDEPPRFTWRNVTHTIYGILRAMTVSVWWRAPPRAERKARLALERVCNLPSDTWPD